MKDKSKGFSWLGFFFNIYYYAGYGKLKLSIIFTVIFALLLGILGGLQSKIIYTSPNVGIILYFIVLTIICLSLPIYAGIKAKKDLPIKQIKFKWLNCLWIFLIYTIIYVITGFIVTLISSNSEKLCSEITTKSLVISIAEDKLKDANLAYVIPYLKFKVYDIKELSHSNGLYKCSATFSMINKSSNKTKVLPITYTARNFDNGKREQVYVKGFN